MPNQAPTPSAPVEEQPDMLYGTAWMQLAITSCITEEAQDAVPYNELEVYLTSPLKPWPTLPNAALIKWWKDHSVVYPTLARMA